MATVLRQESAVVGALRQRFPAPAWAMFTGVANATGHRANRWADAVAMSVWPSRGLEVFGFEIKVSRGDFLREIKKPEKAEEVASYCDKWWIAVGDKKIAAPEELPENWGLLVPHGATMKIVKEARKLTAKKLDRSFVAAILRRAAEYFDEGAIRKGVRRELYEEIRGAVDESAALQLEDERKRRKTAEGKLRTVEQQLGDAIKLDYSPNLIGKAIELLFRFRGWNGAVEQIDQLTAGIERHQAKLASLTESMDLAREICAIVDPPEQEPS